MNITITYTDGYIEDMVKAMDDEANDWELWHKRSWGRGSSTPDAGMVKCGKADARSLRKVGKLIKSGKVQEAAEFASNLDTIVREAIPDKVWEFLMQFNH
jgi:hypothetical protein